jgi:hypothetical protein
VSTVKAGATWGWTQLTVDASSRPTKNDRSWTVSWSRCPVSGAFYAVNRVAGSNLLWKLTPTGGRRPDRRAARGAMAGHRRESGRRRPHRRGLRLFAPSLVRCAGCIPVVRRVGHKRRAGHTPRRHEARRLVSRRRAARSAANA